MPSAAPLSDTARQVLIKQVEAGRQARECREDGYVPGLLDAARQELTRRILDLSPSQSAAFSLLKARLEQIEDLRTAMEADIAAARQAEEVLGGNHQPKPEVKLL